ncbi:MAG TPA: nicotinate phosphoribosyltransferase [Bryobacteraceae bacterium]|nr:nicotinate phosphoribosyltransferase [Bryobacteraceae bacterium]
MCDSLDHDPPKLGAALNTDLYELTMAAGYFEAGKTGDRATFELFVRRLPWNRNFVLAAGLAQAVEYLQNLRFTAAEIAYLKTLPQFEHTRPEFFDMLATLRFSGDVFAVREGTPLFGGEPFLTIRAPLIEAQLVETYLLATIGFQSTIATKAARVVRAAGGHGVVEFGTRRAHSPEAGVLAARAAYIGGCMGTSNAETGFRYGVPVFGTAGHSWVMSFPGELAAFERLQQLLGESTVYLIDTYDTLAGARRAASLGRPLWGVRLDSGNLGELAAAVRGILNEAGLADAKIMATGDLNEHKIQELMAARAPIDVFGVGTDLATSADAPSMGVVYKLVELEDAAGRRYPVKLSHDKQTLPGAKQIFRSADHDVLARATECYACAEGGAACEALQRPVMIAGRQVESLPPVAEVRRYAAESLGRLPATCLSLFAGEPAWRVDISPELSALYESVSKGAAV